MAKMTVSTPVRCFPSSSNPSKFYTVYLAPDGSMSCDCPGWSFKRPGKERHCKHLDLMLEPFDMKAAIEAALRRHNLEPA